MEQLSTDPRLAQILREEVEGFRARVTERLEAAEQVSREEVLASGEAVQRIVDQARSCIDSSQELLQHQLEAVQEYSGLTEESVLRHRSAVEQATLDTAQVAQASERVGKLAQQANMLSLNAHIEAVHAGEGSAAFVVIASEMQGLSEAIQETTRRVAKSVSSLATSLEELQGQASMIERTNGQFCDRIRDLSGRAVSQLGNGEESEGPMHEIVQTAYQALSHLQFQDPMIQDLRRIRPAMDRFLCSLFEHLDLPVEGMALDPEDSVDILLGDRLPAPTGDPEEEAVEAIAGEVMLF